VLEENSIVKLENATARNPIMVTCVNSQTAIMGKDVKMEEFVTQ